MTLEAINSSTSAAVAPYLYTNIPGVPKTNPAPKIDFTQNSGKLIITSNGSLVLIPSNKGRVGAPEISVQKLGDKYLVRTKKIVFGAKPEYKLLTEEQFLEEFSNCVVYSPKKKGKENEEEAETEKGVATTDAEKPEDKKWYQYSLAYKVAEATKDGEWYKNSLAYKTAEAIKDYDITKYGLISFVA